MSDDKKIDSLKHQTPKRLHIPSKEEEGFESHSDIVAGKKTSEIPLNPVTHRGQDPELYWMHKYGEGDEQTHLNVDIRSLYRHEHIAPETLIKRLYDLKREASQNQDMFEGALVDTLFGNYQDIEELDKPQSYYQHADRWSNRLIQGDSLLTMTSLLEREGLSSQVQMIYIDPPYGIKYGSNWQIKLNDRNVKDGDDAALSGEPEVVKAFRDTWELGIHSYLSYLRERLLVAKELLTSSGSCFVQISDENVHLVRCLMDEVFGSGNFVSLISVRKTGAVSSPDARLNSLGTVGDFILWYAKSKEMLKYRQLFGTKEDSDKAFSQYNMMDTAQGPVRHSLEQIEKLTEEERLKLYQSVSLESNGYSEKFHFTVSINDRVYKPASTRHWSTTEVGIKRLVEKGRILQTENKLRYKRYFGDFPVSPIANFWSDLMGSSDLLYVVQTNAQIIQRCILMTTDPGDLVLDPTCGSGTTAFVAEQWGRRWITTDTSRIALNIAKTRLMTATYPWYTLKDEADRHSREGGNPVNAAKPLDSGLRSDGRPRNDGQGWDLRNGFVYKTVPHVTLKSLANDEPPETETLFDQPQIDKKKLRVAGPFTVETLQAFEPLPPEALSDAGMHAEAAQNFTQRVFEHLKSAGVKNGDRNETAVFTRVDSLGNEYLHAEGYYRASDGERKAYIHIGPQFGAVSRQAVNEAVKLARRNGDADWLIILGFAFESDIDTQQSTKLGKFEVSKARMHDDLLQEGLMKKDKKAASFVTIGEPDIALVPSPQFSTPSPQFSTPSPQPLSPKEMGAVPPSPSGRGAGGEGRFVQVEIRGLDIYDPVKDEVKARSVADIAYWMVDDDYDGSNFMVRQVFFCGGDHDEFDKWQKGLSDLAKQVTKRKLEQTLKIEIDEQAFDRVYGFQSHPIPATQGRKVAVRVISQFGEESTKVLAL